MCCSLLALHSVEGVSVLVSSGLSLCVEGPFCSSPGLALPFYLFLDEEKCTEGIVGYLLVSALPFLAMRMRGPTPRKRLPVVPGRQWMAEPASRMPPGAPLTPRTEAAFSNARFVG